MKTIQKMMKILNEKSKKFNRDRSNSRRFRIFYGSTKEDKRNDIAKIVDYILWRILIFFGTFIMAFLKKPNLYLSTLKAIIVLCIYHIISIIIRRKKLEEQKVQKRNMIASQRIYKEILNKTMDEMKEYITEILIKSGFKEIKSIGNDHKSIVLQAVYNHNDTMISCYNYKTDFDIELKELKEFLCQLTEHKIKKGLIITTSDFTQDCYNYLDRINDNYNILLINKEKLFKIIESKEMFPTDEEIDEVIENQISKKKKNWNQYKVAALSNKKTKGYLFLSIFLVIASFYTPYTIYYMVIASITMFLTIITFLLHIYNKKHLQQGKFDDIENMFQDF